MKLNILQQDINLKVESNFIFSSFINELEKTLNKNDVLVFRKKMRLTTNDIVFAYPYYVAETFNSTCHLNVIRSFALGNYIGATTILMQDRIIDKQVSFVEGIDSLKYLLLSTPLFYMWIKEYQRIFESNHLFWSTFENYLKEFTKSSLWEKNEHFAKLAPYSKSDLNYLAHKFSLLKISSTGLCLYFNQKNKIPVFEKIVNNYHIGFQLVDDFNDWHEDFHSDNYTWLLTDLLLKLNIKKNVPHDDKKKVEKALSEMISNKKNVEPFVATAIDAFQEAIKLCDKMNCNYLKNLIINREKNAYKIIESQKSHHFFTSPKEHIKLAKLHWLDDKHFFIRETGKVLKADMATKKIITKLQAAEKNKINNLHDYINNFTKSEEVNIISELRKLNLIIPISKNNLNGMLESRFNCQTMNKIEIEVFSANGKKMGYNLITETINKFILNSGANLKPEIYISKLTIIDNEKINAINEICKYTQSISEKIKKNISINIFAQLETINQESIIALLKLPIDSLTINLLNSNEKINRIQINDTRLKIIHSKNPEKYFKIRSSYNPQNRCSISKNELQYLRILRNINKREVYCLAGIDRKYISFHGNEYPCSKFSHANEDMTKTNNFDIELFELHSLPEKCERCWCKIICNGGCKFQHLNEKNSEIWCAKTKNTIEQILINKYIKKKDLQLVFNVDNRYCNEL